jgi:hypothetical protein
MLHKTPGQSAARRAKASKARRHGQDNVRDVVLDLHQSLPRSRISIVQGITNNLQ